MKTAYLGWEANALASGQNANWSTKLTVPIILRGYQFDISMSPIASPNIPFLANTSVGQASEILFQAMFGSDANPDFSIAVMGSNVHSAPVGSGVFCTAILKTWVPGPPTASAVNKSIVQSGLSIAVPQDTTLSMFAGLLGWTMDFEVQGVLYYDINP